LASGKTGLKNTNNSDSPSELTGNDLTDGLWVTVTASATLYWRGTLKVEGGKNKCNLKCTNTTKKCPPDEVLDTEDVSVTAGTSQPFATTVDVGP
jgi:hypothetical protein